MSAFPAFGETHSALSLAPLLLGAHPVVQDDWGSSDKREFDNTLDKVKRDARDYHIKNRTVETDQKVLLEPGKRRSFEVECVEKRQYLVDGKHTEQFREEDPTQYRKFKMTINMEGTGGLGVMGLGGRLTWDKSLGMSKEQDVENFDVSDAIRNDFEVTALVGKSQHVATTMKPQFSFSDAIGTDNIYSVHVLEMDKNDFAFVFNIKRVVVKDVTHVELNDRGRIEGKVVNVRSIQETNDKKPRLLDTSSVVCK